MSNKSLFLVFVDQASISREQLEELISQAYHKNNLEGPKNLLIVTKPLEELRTSTSETSFPFPNFTSPYQGRYVSELASLLRSQPAGPSAFSDKYFLVANSEAVSSRKAFLAVHVKDDGSVDELLMAHHSMCDALSAIGLGSGSFVELKTGAGERGVYPAKKHVKQGGPAPKKAF